MFRKLPDPAAKTVSLSIDGTRVEAEEGESVAAVLLRQPERWVRMTPVAPAPRAPYCMMGVCFDCLAIVDGVASVQTCLTPVRDGMMVNRQRDRPGLT
ncbi:MAG: (2Fe-2S)-binding protein [Rhodospirillales bacterium]|nr:(2Fe-2S)-binding protein [Rhodospirillales bacterium]